MGLARFLRLASALEWGLQKSSYGRRGGKKVLSPMKIQEGAHKLFYRGIIYCLAGIVFKMSIDHRTMELLIFWLDKLCVFCYAGL